MTRIARAKGLFKKGLVKICERCERFALAGKDKVNDLAATDARDAIAAARSFNVYRRCPVGLRTGKRGAHCHSGGLPLNI
jgi:hypothetical protein